MTLSEFILFCRLSGLIKRQSKIDNWHYKVLIEDNNNYLELLYSINLFDEGVCEVVKCNMTCDAGYIINPHVSTIVETFFPSK